MSKRPFVTPPEGTEEWEARVQETARHLTYPETPNLAARVRLRSRSGRRWHPAWRWATALLLFVLLLVAAVPEVRALVLEFIRVGAVRIFPVQVSETPPVYYPGQPTPLPSTRLMPGETNLTEARAKSGFDFQLPAYPADLGQPNHVYLQDRGEKLVTLVWLKADGSERLILEILDEQLLASKFSSLEDSQPVTVNGEEGGLWLPSPHWVIYFFSQDGFILSRVVQGSVLIWQADGLTYRLESDLRLDEARRVAESLP